MKYKIYGVLLICLIIFSITACSSNHDKQTTEITDEKSYFEATILKKTDNAILVGIPKWLKNENLLIKFGSI